MRGADVEKVPEPKGEATFFCTHYVTMTYDRSPWVVEDDNKTQPDDPIAGLDVRVGIHTSAGGADMPSSKIPKLDELQKLIKDQLGYDLGRLYDCHHEFLADGGIRVAVQFNLASLVPFISDIGPTITTVFGVGFQEALNSDITLSILCSSFYIDVNAEETSATGALYEYNPTVREMKGDRHFICGTVTSARKNFCPLRSRVSKACCPSIDSVNPGSLPTAASTARQKPAKVTERFGQRVENNINQLLEPLGYSEAVIHNLSQANVTAAMYYHMSNKQLELTGQTRPTNLATSLADSLPDELSSFLREKYASAFLCQVVKRDKTYGKKLTDQEKRNLWYWWNGNGKQCLSRSKEYAEITRIASTEALIEYMGDDLQRFLDDDPQTWARRLYDEITQERRMYMYMKYPMQGAAGTKQSSGVNVMNRVCTMLDALDRSHNYADDWFQATMAFVGARQLQYPSLASDSQDSDQAAEWLADILHRLIVQVLDGDGDDGTLDPDVRAGLRENIVAFEEANGLNSSGRTAEDRATEIVRTLGEFTTSLGGWMSAIDKGLAAAFAGTSLYKWTEEAFANLSDAWGDKIPGLSKMKGAVSIAMVGVYMMQIFGSVYGIIHDWDNMSDTQKAAAILEVIGTTVEGISSAKESWDAYRTRAKAENFEDYVQTSELDRGTYTALSEDGEGIAEVCEAVNPDVSLHEVVGDHLTPEGQATTPDDAEHWNEPPDRPPAGVPPEGEDVASKWSIGGRALKLFNVCLGIVLVGAAIYSLVEDWNKLSTGEKILDIPSDLTQTLQVVLDIVELFTGPDFVTATGIFATALPVLGAVLAIIGLVLMLVNFFISLFSPPPEDPVDTFLKKQGKPLLDALDAPPDPQLQYTLSTDTVHAHAVDPLAVTGTNTTDQPVTVPNVRVSLTGGTTAENLFDADHFDLVAADDPARDEPEHVYVAPAATAGAAMTTSTLGNGAKNEYHEYEVEIAGCQPGDDQAKTGSHGTSSLPPLVLQPGESFTVQWTAAVNKKGDSLVDVIEKSMLDRCHVQMPVVRV
ncbi:uncharacterized protein LDX57_006827 [Aspergillus melleus]|uniref:uncharacterized protein n=1 Tax=Aspergillus melleus TaxID=138277 RepID=UPI001E8DD4B6|nr:uncharacterized protein LDX57_006827 [Aspergillus melleus]KAH8429158.1 hypothetical protein LDX57_006827 [Aspergillus melleus]